jgi:hypothetical protein
MEDDLCSARDLAHAMALLAEALNDQLFDRPGEALHRCRRLFGIDAAEEKRCAVFRLTNRARFEKTGWPGVEQGAASA